MCEIIPKKILKSIAENDKSGRKNFYKSIISETKEEEYRKKRKQISQNLLKGVEPNVDRAHTETLTVFDNQYKWDYSRDKLWEEFIQEHTHNPSKIPKRVFTRDMDKVYDLFHDVLNRESFDNKNAIVNVFLKYGVNYVNAYWDSEYLVFGTGDKYYFRDFSKDYTVLAHEYSHAITQYESNLQYELESGALNESISDVFAIIAYQKKYNLSVEKSDWIIGPKVFSSKVNGKGLRSFKDEVAYDDSVVGTDSQPKYMKDFIVAPNDEENDWGALHENSGIVNHTFYLYNTKLGGKTWENGSLDVWYNTLLKENGLNPYATFKEFANKSLEISNKLGKDTSKLESSWKEIGVL